MENPFKSKLKALYATMIAFLGVKSLIKDGKLELSDDHRTKLEDEFGEKINLEKVTKAFNQELADMADAIDDGDDDQKKDKKEKLLQELIAQGLAQEDAKDTLEDPAAIDNTKSIEELAAELIAQNRKKDKIIEQLMKEPEVDSPLASGKHDNLKNMHSNTHFLGSGKAWDAFEDRPWNQAAAGLIKDFNVGSLSKVDVQKLNDDADLYVREVNADLNSLERDRAGLPSFWKVITNVVDKIADGNIVSGEVTQARKKNWLPKGKQMIQPEESQIFPVQIDLEFAGYTLQDLLTSWISSYNKEGSQAYKMSFVRYLISELLKKARQEDRKVAINGVYVKTPDTSQVPGRAINRGDGIVYKLWKAFWIDKKFKIAKVAAPTPQNIVDHVPEVIEANLKEEDKNQDGLVFYLSPSWLRKYKARKRQLFGLDNDYNGDKLMEIENYPNIRFYPLRDLEGSDFMFITDDNNIDILENIPGEKSLLHFEMLKRILYIFGDYKFGVRFKHIGTKVKDEDPAAFKVQTVWANMPPYLHDTFVQIYDDTTGEVTIPYSNVQVAADWETNITDIKGTYPGQVVKLRGTAGTTGNVVSTGNLTLASNFALSTGGTLTLIVNQDLTLTELSRTVTAPTNDEEAAKYEETIDATDGDVFEFSGTSAQTLDQITEGFNGQQILVKGGAGGAVTINNVAGNIAVDSEAVLADAADNITFVKVDGVWTEIARTIAA